jgi:iron-sulfur cluster assembly protein
MGWTHNTVIVTCQGLTMTIQLTESAAQRIQKQIEQRGHGLGLKVGVKKAGCSGYAYLMDYADTLEPQDQVFEQHGATVIVASEHLPMLAGLTLDYLRDGLNASFQFRNPNVTATCGCGESFAVT